LIKALLTHSSDRITGQIHTEVERKIGGIKISERTFRNYVKVLADRGEIIRKRSGKGQRGWTQVLRLK
jgi:repressor of nif and glnA expression